MNLYDRANHFRRNNEYDKAMGIFEQVLQEDRTDAEAYWSLVLCRYGIEYVEDPATGKRIPTVHRVQFTSILADEDYKSALEYADSDQKAVYEQEAKAIDAIQKGILDISKREKPFDVFICYKETDAEGKRTPDSVLANDLYHQLTREGFKVFFSRITLEDKLGQEYEPYIFAALNSAKVMVVLGTKPEYFKAVWVKNEWSRYLALIKAGQNKTLVPAYKDMDPYDLPEEFSHLQAQDMSKLGFMQDLIHGIRKLAGEEKIASSKQQVMQQTVVSNGSTKLNNLYKRALLFLEDGDFNEAAEYADKILDEDAEFAEAYMVKVLAAHRCRSEQELENCRADAALPDMPDMRKAIRFAKDGSTYNHIADRVANNARFAQAVKPLNIKLNEKNGTDANAEVVRSELKHRIDAEGTADAAPEAYRTAATQLKQLGAYPCAAECAGMCEMLADIMQQLNKYNELCKEMNRLKGGNEWKQYQYAAAEFAKLGSFRDNAEKSKQAAKAATETVQRLYECGLNAIKAATTHRENKEKLAILTPLAAVISIDEAIKLYDQKTVEIDAAINAEKERREAARKKAAAEFAAAEAAAKQKKLIAGIAAATIAVVAALYIFVLQPMMNYNAAKALFDAHKYEEAITVFEALDGYSDSEEQITVCQSAIKERDYTAAKALFDAHKYEEAITAFEALDGYSDSEEQITACQSAIKERDYTAAKALFDAHKYEEAITAFEALDGYSDSEEQITTCQSAIKERDYAAAKMLLSNGQYAEAYAAFCLLKGYKDVDKLLKEDENLIAVEAAVLKRESYTKVGNIVTYGHYEQDNNTDNGKEAVEWIVLRHNYASAMSLLISRYGLDARCYHPGSFYPEWEHSDIREWLNGEFLNEAFTQAEQAGIVTVNISTPAYKGRSGGADTKDKIWLLSRDEARTYFASDTDRKATPTKYAAAKWAVQSSSDTLNGTESCSWWLRSPGFYIDHASEVGKDGSFVNGFVDYTFTIRPAFWLDLDADIF